MAKPKKDKAESRKISNKNLIPFTTLPEDEMRNLPDVAAGNHGMFTGLKKHLSS
ncbi:hypothetical protein AAIR98_000118 [Elusimicrobium simillimum]|uniref:hypothetical protein n=1 Tax=Elusimicrobium simillimum TaxID=3143438 RepID=UPI003C701EF7